MRKPIVLKKGDLMIIAALLLISLTWLVVLFLQRNSGAQGLEVEIYRDGLLLYSIALEDGEQELRLENGSDYNLLQIGPQGVRMLEANCHNRDCVNAGLQDRAGGVIACLPHRLLICLKGGREADFDAVTR